MKFGFTQTAWIACEEQESVLYDEQTILKGNLYIELIPCRSAWVIRESGISISCASSWPPTTNPVFRWIGLTEMIPSSSGNDHRSTCWRLYRMTFCWSFMPTKILDGAWHNIPVHLLALSALEFKSVTDNIHDIPIIEGLKNFLSNDITNAESKMCQVDWKESDKSLPYAMVLIAD